MLVWAFDEDVYRDKATGGWLGKNIGGTLGGPVEGRKELLDLTFYPLLPQGKPLPNDDLDLQLVWLHALEQYGPGLTAVELGQEWLEHVRFPYDEYGYALANLRRGILPPVSGWFGNPFNDCMGAPIRSEVWAMVAPGLPELAAYYAWNDAVVDHAGGEGVWGEVLFAAIQSAAFLESDPRTLIHLGLSFIPAGSRVAKAVRYLLDLHEKGVPWQEARRRILQHHGRDNFTDAPQNIAFTLLGWLYGNDFGDSLLKATNCGYDTDCTAATLGAILGIIHGADGIPGRWRAPVGDGIVLSPAIEGIEPPATVQELTERTLAMARRTVAHWQVPLHIGKGATTIVPGSRPQVREPLLAVQQQQPTSITVPIPHGVVGQPDMRVTVDFGDEGPAIGRCEMRRLEIALSNLAPVGWQGTVALDVPADWRGPEPLECSIEPGATFVWRPAFQCGSDVAPVYELQLRLVQAYGNRQPWYTRRIPIAMVAKYEWEISDPKGGMSTLSAPTPAVPLGPAGSEAVPGWWRARTTLHSAAGQAVNLIVATTRPFVARFRGSEVLKSGSTRSFMPAYHRPHGDTVTTVFLQRGRNELEIDILMDKDIEPVMIALVNPTRGYQHAVLDVVAAVEQAASRSDPVS